MVWKCGVGLHKMWYGMIWYGVVWYVRDSSLDGLLFDATDPNNELCDYPFNVDCGDREYVRE